jgi:hypothetical protein
MKARTFADLMAGRRRAEIYCLYTQKLVRILTLVDGQVHVDFTNGESTDIPLETPIWYEPWFMDRGSMLFSCRESAQAKICTEADVIRFPDGVEDRVMPDLG